MLAPALAASLDKRALAAGLASLPLIAYDEDLPLVRPVWNAMFRLPPPCRRPAAIPDLRIIQDLVIAGHSWSVLPDYLCAPALKAGRLAAWPRAAVAQRNDLYLVWNKGAMRNPRTVHARDAILRLFDSA